MSGVKAAFSRRAHVDKIGSAVVHAYLNDPVGDLKRWCGGRIFRTETAYLVPQDTLSPNICVSTTPVASVQQVNERQRLTLAVMSFITYEEFSQLLEPDEPSIATVVDEMMRILIVDQYLQGYTGSRLVEKLLKFDVSDIAIRPLEKREGGQLSEEVDVVTVGLTLTALYLVDVHAINRGFFT